MLFLFALAAAAVIALVLWKVMTGEPPQSSSRADARPAAPDDDPEFLRQLSERLRREGEDRR